MAGTFVVDIVPTTDVRGFFARTWDLEEFLRRGLDTRISQCSISHNVAKGTLRGIHYQAAPYEETKIVSCLRGAVYDIVLDLRRDSPTYMRWAAVELTGDNYRALYIPKGCGHGFQTLTPNADVFYQISERYAPDHARGVRWDDPAFGIEWPPAERQMSDRDRSYPDFEE